MRAEYALHWSQLKYFLLYMVKWHSLRSLGGFKEGGEGCEKPHLPNPLVVGCKDIFFVYKKTHWTSGQNCGQTCVTFAHDNVKKMVPFCWLTTLFLTRYSVFRCKNTRQILICQNSKLAHIVTELPSLASRYCWTSAIVELLQKISSMCVIDWLRCNAVCAKGWKIDLKN